MSVFDRVNQMLGNEEFVDGSDAVDENGDSDIEVKLHDAEDAEIGVVDGEIAEIKEEIDTAERDVEELEEKAAATESIQDALEEFHRDGGISQQAARLAQSQLKKTMEGCGVSTFALGAENFETSSARARNGVAAVESIGDSLKKIWEFIKATALKIWNFMKDLWSKVSFQQTRLKNRLIKLQNVAGSLKNTNTDGEVKVGGDSKLYLNGKFIGQSNTAADSLKRFASNQKSYLSAAAQLADSTVTAVKGTGEDAARKAVSETARAMQALIRTGTKATKAPISGDNVVQLPTLPGNKTVFIATADIDAGADAQSALKSLRKVNAIFGSVGGEISKVDKVKVSTPSEVVGRLKGLAGALEELSSTSKASDALNKELKDLNKMNIDGFERKSSGLKLVRQLIALIRKLTSGVVVGATQHYLSVISSHASFAAREIKVLGKKKKEDKKED